MDLSTPAKLSEVGQSAFPTPAKTFQANLVGSHQLPASNAWDRSGDRSGDAGVLSVAGARYLTLIVRLTSENAGDYAELIPLVAFTESKPAADADEWQTMDANDGVV